jgi:hypothetical protein
MRIAILAPTIIGLLLGACTGTEYGNSADTARRMTSDGKIVTHDTIDYPHDTLANRNDSTRKPRP